MGRAWGMQHSSNYETAYFIPLPLADPFLFLENFNFVLERNKISFSTSLLPLMHEILHVSEASHHHVCSITKIQGNMPVWDKFQLINDHGLL